ncbi:MAG: hypothetical protein ACRDU9_07705, partial [Acidimicrobiia bacterium]
MATARGVELAVNDDLGEIHRVVEAVIDFESSDDCVVFDLDEPAMPDQVSNTGIPQSRTRVT